MNARIDMDPEYTDEMTPLDTRRDELALEGWGIPYYGTIASAQTKRFIDRIIELEELVREQQARLDAVLAIAARWHERYKAADDMTEIIDRFDDAAHELEDAVNATDFAVLTATEPTE